MYWQQGDVLVRKIDKLPRGLKKKTTNILVPGQNNHELNGGNFTNYGSHLVVKRKSSIIHPQHDKIDIPKGIYAIKIVSEYDHFLEESREVKD